MLGFVRSACLWAAFACLVSLPTDGPTRLRGLPVALPRRAPRATAPACGDGGGFVVRAASQSSQRGSSALLRKVHAAHAHCTPSAPTPSAGPWRPSPPKPPSLLVATRAAVPAPMSKQLSAPPPRGDAAAAAAAATVSATAAVSAAAAVSAPPAPPAPPAPLPRKDAIIPAAAASAGTKWLAPRERPPTPSAPAAGRQRLGGAVHVQCGVAQNMACGEIGRAGWKGGRGGGSHRP